MHENKYVVLSQVHVIIYGLLKTLEFKMFGHLILYHIYLINSSLTMIKL